MDKQILLEIISLSSKKSFIYHLHYRQKFSQRKFNLLKKAYKIYLEKYSDDSSLLLDFITSFQHLLFLFYCDENIHDQFKIKPALNAEDKMNIYFAIREITENLLSNRNMPLACH